MENRIESSDGAEVPRKSRSLDLKSLYKYRVTKDVQNKKLKRKASADDGDENSEKKKKKSVKEVSLSSLKNTSSSSKKNVDKDCHKGLSSGLHDSKDLKLEAKQKLNGSIGFKSVSSLSLNDDAIQIPRRKRGFVGRKKGEGGHVPRRQGLSCGKLDLVDQISKLSGDDSGSQVESVKVKRTKGFDDFKENRNSESNSARHAEEEHGRVNHPGVSNGDSLFKKSRRKRSKTKNLSPDDKVGAKEAEPLADNSTMMCNDSQEDDEENLEENAAMMLSSRFDPNCTGFSSNKASAFATVDGLSFLLSSGRDFVSRRSRSLSGSDSPSVDAAGRVLRPRIQHKEKGHSRKRRHFYEVFFGDLDADWVLNRRIKVFWPLDQSWYYGLVNDYDREKKLHHVKYDDRDEEWIDLQNERFKLLLLPSEVPGKAACRRSRIRDRSSVQRKSSSKPKKEKKKGDISMQDDSCIGSNYMDSEPIISWLARSRRRVKSPFHALKKQKPSDLSVKPVLPPFSNNAVNSSRCFESGTVRRDKRKLSRNSNLSGRFANDAMKEESTSESISCPKDSKMPIVYFRRRFRKTGLELSRGCEDNHACRNILDPVSSFAPAVDDTRDWVKWDVLLGRLDPGGLLWSVDDAGLLKLTLPGLESGKFKFDVDFPILSGLYDLFGVENLWLSHSAVLLRYGTVMIRWPQVHLEMLFVDNVFGLRFLLFEGCLNQALALVFLVVRTFHEPTERVKFVDMPVTSIRFKLTCFQHHKKHLEFAFCNFSTVENSKWIYLDRKLRRHCLVTKQLPLPECTYDNIKMLQNRTVHSPLRSVCGQPSFIKGTRKRLRQGINFMGISRESAFMDIGRSSHFDKMHKKLPPLALSFTAAPTFFLSLHLKMLMEHSLAHISLREHDSEEHLENSWSMTADDSSSMEEYSNKGSEMSLEENTKALSGEVASDGCFSSGRPELSNGLSVCCGRDQIKAFQPCHNGDAIAAGTSADSPVHKKIRTDATVQLQGWKGHHSESDQSALLSRSLDDRDKSEKGSESFVNGLSVEIPPFNQFEKTVDGELHGAQQATDLSWNTNGAIFSSPNPTAPRSTWHRNKHNSSFGHLSHGWSDGKADPVYNGFGNGPKKPRTQVSYLLPFGGFDCSPKQKSIQKGLPSKRLRKASEKRSSDVSRGSQRNLELLSCDVNILITATDRGWRECGAQVVLELFDDHEWKLAVKLSGVTKYSYKAHQFLQPGSTNRFTHAMMWKGGKDWTLEFMDRSQWALFKEMHEECYNRNIQAASVKSIPIPGVRLIEEGDDNGTELAFVRSSAKYFRQVETDIEMALNPSRVLYDMDSDDEQWIMMARSSSELDSGSLGKISEEMFEKTMDMFERAAYAHQRDQLTLEEIEELTVGVGPMDVIKVIYEHWRLKRQKNGMPLIRHLQPPLWERYQQEVREWELAMTRINANLPNGCQEKTAQIEKPPMFAFCMKPRGLEVPNKGSKQRSHRKISVSGKSNTTFGDQDGLHAYGRRLNGFSFGDEKFVYPGYNYDSLEDSPLPQTPRRMFLPRDAGSMSMTNYGLDRNHSYKFQRSKSKKYGNTVSPNNPQTMGLYGHRVVGNGSRNGLHRWNMGFSEWSSQQHFQPEPSQRHFIEQLDGSDLDEYRVRDASSAAQRALNIAKLKREKAQRLVCRADFAIHRAVAALMTAEAIRDCPEDDSDSDGDD